MSVSWIEAGNSGPRDFYWVCGSVVCAILAFGPELL